MRRLAAALCIGLLACASDAPDDAEMAPDTAAVMPAAPAGVTLADVTGTWNVEVMPLDRDTVVTSYVLNATSDTAWTFTFPGREPIPMHVVAVAGDSIVTHAGPFVSAVRSGNVQTEANSVVRLQGGMLVGTVVAHYKTNTPDSVVTYRTRGTRGQ